MVNYDTWVTINAPDEYEDVYMDIANSDQYDKIIGMPFMREHKVYLGFVNDWVIINGMATLA